MDCDVVMSPTAHSYWTVNQPLLTRLCHVIVIYSSLLKGVYWKEG